MTLYPDQQEIYEGVISDIEEALSGDIFCEHSFLSISGAAGTGKTFLSHSIVDTLVNKLKLKVAVLAPTHKALKVIRSNINVDNKDITYATVHSFLGLKPQIDYKTGEQKFVKDKSKQASKLSKIKVDLMIVDESSFISTSLFEHIKKESLVYNRVKVTLFIGDRLQLLPVEDSANLNEKDVQAKSAIFDESGDNIINHYLLTEPKRNGNTEVLDFYTEVRRMVERGALKRELIQYLLDESEKPHEKVKFFRDKRAFVTDYIQEDRLGKEDDVIVTFTNENVNSYNEKIRDYYLKKELGEVPEIHETDLFVVQGGSEDFVNSETIDVKRYNLKDFNYKGKIFKGYQCQTSDGRYYNIISKESKADYERSLELLKINAAKEKSRGAWQMYYGLIEMFLSVKYQYSMTIHKSQGSSMTNVYVDCTGINYVDDDMMLRLFYVAATRARDTVNILI
jgi:ATP-dependent exoDNAse (exonuclease V) alpha subunit